MRWRRQWCSIFHYYWWTASIKPRLCFPYRLCFLRAFTFISLICQCARFYDNLFFNFIDGNTVVQCTIVFLFYYYSTHFPCVLILLFRRSCLDSLLTLVLSWTLANEKRCPFLIQLNSHIALGSWKRQTYIIMLNMSMKRATTRMIHSFTHSFELTICQIFNLFHHRIKVCNARFYVVVREKVPNILKDVVLSRVVHLQSSGVDDAIS